MNSIDETKLLNYLAGYDSAFLYQKTGFLVNIRQSLMKLLSVFSIKVPVVENRRFIDAVYQSAFGEDAYKSDKGNK